MTPDEQALLAAVHADPDDDLPRLVYADWLEERGGEADAARAEFIRRQIRLATLDERDPEYDTLDQCCRELHESNWTIWEAGTDSERYSNAYAQGAMHRGFYDHIHLSDSYFNRPEFVAALPRYTFTSIELGALKADSPLLAWSRWSSVRKLSFCADCSEARNAEAVRRLLSSPAIAGLRELDLSYSGLGDADTALVAENPVLGNLRTLNFYGRELTNEFVRAVFGSSTLLRLEGLSFRNALSTTDVLPLFRDAAVTPNLRELSFDGVYSSDARNGKRQLLDLLAVPRLGPLRKLKLTSCGLNNHDVAAMQLGRRFPGLRSLDLSGNRLRAAAAIDILTDPGLAQVTTLNLSDNRLGGEWIDRLNGTPMTALRRLRLERCRLTDRDVERLAASPGLQRVHELGLEDNRFGDRGVTALVRSPHLRQLQGLCLRGCKVGSVGVQALATAPFASRVRFSDLMSNGLDSDWLREAGPRLFGWDEHELGRIDMFRNISTAFPGLGGGSTESPAAN